MMKLKYYDAIAKKYNLLEHKRNIILIGTPNHGNLGDQAIAYAEMAFLKKFFSDSHIVEVSMQDFAVDIDALHYLIGSDDIIMLQGGGNCGNFYMDDEMLRRYVVLRFTHNKIILFPQSVYFTDDENGRNEREISSRIYNSNKNLYLIARDAASEEQFQKFFRNKVYKLPDVVLTLSQWRRQNDKKGVMLCLRNDEEGTLDNAQKERIEKLLKVRYEIVRRTDTVIEYDGQSFQREFELERLLNEIGSSELVVTDRLHGMIFAIITGTPCIVFPTFNTKIVSAFEEVKNITNVSLVRNAEELADALDKVCLESRTYKNESVLQAYQRVFNDIISKDIVCCDIGDYPAGSKILEIAGYWSAQHYETAHWKAVIESEYKKLESSNHDRLNELATYKTWVASLEEKLEQIKSDYQGELAAKDKETESYKKWVSGLETQLEQMRKEHQEELSAKEKEAINYKEWVNNLTNEKRQEQRDYQNSLNSKNKEVEDYKKWVKNLESQIIELTAQNQSVLDHISEKDKEILNYRKLTTDLQKDIEHLITEAKDLKNELQNRERQWNIQQREMYKCIKFERENNNNH